jgi:hypothetical protein
MKITIPLGNQREWGMERETHLVQEQNLTTLHNHQMKEAEPNQENSKPHRRTKTGQADSCKRIENWGTNGSVLTVSGEEERPLQSNKTNDKSVSQMCCITKESWNRTTETDPP